MHKDVLHRRCDAYSYKCLLMYIIMCILSISVSILDLSGFSSYLVLSPNTLSCNKINGIRTRQISLTSSSQLPFTMYSNVSAALICFLVRYSCLHYVMCGKCHVRHCSIHSNVAIKTSFRSLKAGMCLIYIYASFHWSVKNEAYAILILIIS